MKWEGKLRNLNYHVQIRITKIQLSSTKKNFETLIIKCKEKLRNFNYEGQKRNSYQVQRRITKV